jgi:hypothetical protein
MICSGLCLFLAVESLLVARSGPGRPPQGWTRFRGTGHKETGLSTIFEALGSERSGSMTLDLSSTTPAEEGFVTLLSEGRWRVTRKGNREDLTREVEVRAGEETHLDPR